MKLTWSRKLGYNEAFESQNLNRTDAWLGCDCAVCVLLQFCSRPVSHVGFQLTFSSYNSESGNIYSGNTGCAAEVQSTKIAGWRAAARRTALVLCTAR